MKKNYNVVNEIESPELINLNKKNVMKSVDTIVNNLLKYNVGYPLSGVKTNVTKKQDLSIGHNYFYRLRGISTFQTILLFLLFDCRNRIYLRKYQLFFFLRLLFLLFFFKQINLPH